MAPPRKPDNERKTAYAVSLTMKQRETFQAMGGSPWLQNILDHEWILMEAGRKALPHLVACSKGKPAGKANAASCGIVTHKSRVLKEYPNAICKRDPTAGPGVTYGIYTEFTERSRNSITTGWMTPKQAWERAAARLELRQRRA